MVPHHLLTIEEKKHEDKTLLRNIKLTTQIFTAQNEIGSILMYWPSAWSTFEAIYDSTSATVELPRLLGAIFKWQRGPHQNLMHPIDKPPFYPTLRIQLTRKRLKKGCMATI